MRRIVMAVLGLCWMAMPVAAAKPPATAPDLSKLTVLDLKTAQALALAGNPNMTVAQARVEQARARVRQAVATWWPSLDLNGSGARQRLSDTAYQSNKALAALVGASTDQTSSQYQANVQATWLLFDGFYRQFHEQQANYEEQATGAGLVDSQRLLVNAVAEAFLNAQLAQTYSDINQADETFYRQQLSDAQNRFEVGAGPWGDVINIKVQVNSARTSVIRSQREYEAAGYGLAALMGQPDAQLPAQVRLQPLDKAVVVREHGESAEQLIKEAVATRPDVRRLEMVVKQSEAATGMAKAPLYPKVQIAGSLDGAKEGNAGISGEDIGSTVGMNMSWNLYAGGADRARMIEAEQAKREAVYTLAGLRNDVASEIRQDLALLSAAKEQLVLQRENVKLVEENRELAKNEYEAGQASLVRLNEAQRDLITAYGRLAQALVGYQLAQQHLLAATGRNLVGLSETGR